VFNLISVGSPLQDQIHRIVQHKAGLSIICSCTNPRNGEPINDCTASEKMSQCFGEGLGFSVFESSDLSINKMHRLLRDLGCLKVPPSCDDDFRFIFYFFGHGTENELCLTDGNVQRSLVVGELQKIDQKLFKIVLFDSCRTKDRRSAESEHLSCNTSAVTMQEPIQEINKMVSLPGGIWKEEEHYPFAQCINTLVIYSTSPYSKAFYYDSDDYPEMKVCGLVTYFFTKLVSTENKALSAILSDVRKEVVSLIREKVSYQSDNPLQVLVYEDLLMGNVNLLAESKGNMGIPAKCGQENQNIQSNL
jgi:hypothetical protein